MSLNFLIFLLILSIPAGIKEDSFIEDRLASEIIEKLLIYDKDVKSALIKKINLKDITLTELSDMFNISKSDKSNISVHTRCSGIYGIILWLDNGYNLLVTLNFPNDFSFQKYGFDYYEETIDDMIDIAFRFKIKYIEVRKYRKSIKDQVKFLSNGGNKLKLHIKNKDSTQQ